MVSINHIAIWTNNLEVLRDFYITYFGGVSNEKYINSLKGFESYFISFSSGVSLELMKSKQLSQNQKKTQKIEPGYAHIAFSLGSKENVDEYTRRLSDAGYQHVDGPRTTGDGFYESVVKDPDGNLIELTV